MSIASFEKAFDTRCGSCMATCPCGRTFYNPDSHGWDWEDGELERLMADETAFPLDYAVSFVSFEGDTYVSDCDCWQERANMIIGFIEGHAHQIAAYLTLEKERKLDKYRSSPIVTGYEEAKC